MAYLKLSKLLLEKTNIYIFVLWEYVDQAFMIAFVNLHKVCFWL